MKKPSGHHEWFIDLILQLNKLLKKRSARLILLERKYNDKEKMITISVEKKMESTK